MVLDRRDRRLRRQQLIQVTFPPGGFSPLRRSSTFARSSTFSTLPRTRLAVSVFVVQIG